jgi:hypothetical protein
MIEFQNKLVRRKGREGKRENERPELSCHEDPSTKRRDSRRKKREREERSKLRFFRRDKGE